MDTVKRTMELLDEHGMTLYQLTQKSGIARATIMQTEKRGGQLKVDTIERICEALGITLSEFFLEAGPQLKKRSEAAPAQNRSNMRA